MKLLKIIIYTQWSVLYSLVILLFLVSCTAPFTSIAPPTPQAVTVSITPSLTYLIKQLHHCASSHPEVALYQYETPAPFFDLNNIDFAIQLGEPIRNQSDGTFVSNNRPQYIARIGWEQIVIIVNKANSVSILSDNTLSGLFSGQITNWDGLGNRTGPVHIYISPEDDDVRHAIESTILQGKPFTTQASIAANPLAMLKVISSDQSAIGYFPQSWFVDASSTPTMDTHIPVLSKELMEELKQPVIVLSHNEPQGAARSLLLCLQSSMIR
jgi:hypothetical protein